MWNVPTTFTPLIGRDSEVLAIVALLKRSDVRLVTLLGTGGIGKTRLSLQVATEVREHFTHGVCFVPLAAVNEPDLVFSTISQELGIQEIGGGSLLEQVKVVLRDKHFLLLLDNFEQVVAAAPLIEDLLAVCLHLKVVVTSRAVLHLQGEHEFPLSPLALPDLHQLPEREALTQYAAIALFVQRTQAILPTFQLTQANAQAVAEICVRLDGLPLAIELAVARIKLLPPQALLARLSHPLQVLTGGAATLPPRQQTLRNTLQWSYNLLDVREQRVFRLLSVFAGIWTLEAVEGVERLINSIESEASSPLDILASLLDKSLLLQIEQEGDEARLIMLETVREYARECLDANGETAITRQAHATYFLTLAEEAESQLKGAQQTRWLERLEREYDNLRAALGWLLEYKEAELALRLCNSLWWFWHLRGHWSEGRRYLAAVLGLARTGEPNMSLARVLYDAADLAYHQDDYAVARSLLEESVAICRQLKLDKELANALGALGVLLHVQDDHDAAHPLLKESETLYRALGSKWELCYFLRKWAQRILMEGDQAQADKLAQEALLLAQELGDKSLIATTLNTLGEIAWHQGDLTQAMLYDREVVNLARELGDKSLSAIALQNLGYIASLQGDLKQAAALAQTGLALARELGDRVSMTWALHSLGYIMVLQGDLAQAFKWYHEGLSLAQEIENETEVGFHLFGLATVAVAEGQFLRATRLLGAVEKRLDIAVDMNADERADYQRAVESVRAQLDAETFAAKWAEGRTMTPERIFALSESAITRQVPAIVSPPPAPTYPDGLTTREVEVLRLLARGWTDTQIAEHLVISPRTVSTHLTSIYRKISVSTRSAATRYALEHKLV